MILMYHGKAFLIELNATYIDFSDNYIIIILPITAIAILSIREVESSPRRKIYIDDIVDLLQQQNHNNLRQKRDDITSDGSNVAKFRVVDDEDNSRYGSMASRDIVELIQ